MMTLTAVALTCWLCALLALPRKPLPNNEVQELVYARLMGRQQTLMLLALFATAGVVLSFVVAILPSRIDPGLETLRRPSDACMQAIHSNSALCSTTQPGTMILQGVREDHIAVVAATIPAPPVGMSMQK